MKIIFFSAKQYDIKSFNRSNQQFKHSLRYVEEKLSINSLSMINNEKAICVFVNDVIDKEVITGLVNKGVQIVALRCAGFNNIDLDAARLIGLKVVRVPAYSPYAVAEHALCLMLSLNRKVYRSYNRVREGDFTLKGLLGFDFHGRTIGIIGTGKIGAVLAGIVSSMGMRVVACDLVENQLCIDLGVEYMSLSKLLSVADVVSLHCPLTDKTNHIINDDAIKLMKNNVMIINTGRGALLDTCAVIEGLKTKKIGYLGMDVYEQEGDIFFQDMTCEIIEDDIFERLLTFHNVLITPHQGFFTEEALKNIADTTLKSVEYFENDKALLNEVSVN